MTLIEFFDSSATENVVGILYGAPKKAIFIGDSRRKMEKALTVYRGFLAARNISTELFYKAVGKHKLNNILSVLAEIIEENEDCVFDLTGGEELYLVAVGILLERYPDRARVLRFNLNTHTAADPMRETSLPLPAFALSAEENIAIHGGKVISGGEDNRDSGDNADFPADVEKIWRIARHAPRHWNAQASILGVLDEHFGSEQSLSLSFLREEAERLLTQRGWRYGYDEKILAVLEEAGLISDLSLGERVSFSFKNAPVKRALTVAGQVLELKVAGHLSALMDGDAPLYTDVRVGVVIDWDRAEEKEDLRTVNEIDVIAMKDAIPVFISCKNGDFDMEELYKLSTVAARFGGRYVKKVLIATELDKLGPKAEHLRARAEDMGIRIIEDVDKMSDAELDRILRSVWSN